MSASSSGSGRAGGNPPVHTRFKPGQSGNRNGRPKGSKNVKTVIEQELGRKVTITENGREVKRTMCEVLLRRLAHDGIKGNAKAAALLLRTARDYGVGESEVGQGALQRTPGDNGALPDGAALRRIARRIDDHLRDREQES